MKIFHHNLEICLNEEWLAAAKAHEFSPDHLTYIVDETRTEGKKVCIIAIDKIAPVMRGPGTDIFNADIDNNLSAMERTLRILKGIVNGDALPPVKLRISSLPQCQFELMDGTHRLYASLALGYKYIPAIQGLDLKTFDAGLAQIDLC